MRDVEDFAGPLSRLFTLDKQRDVVPVVMEYGLSAAGKSYLITRGSRSEDAQYRKYVKTLKRIFEYARKHFLAIGEKELPPRIAHTRAEEAKKELERLIDESLVRNR